MKTLGPLAQEGKINPDASIRDSQSIIINTPISRVWELMSDIQKWSEWNQDIKSVKIDRVEVGADFSWNIDGTTINSTIRQIIPNELISWTGSAMGIKAIHVWRFEEAEGNQTIVTTEESMQGFFTLFFSHQKLHSSLLNWLDKLKQEAEK